MYGILGRTRTRVTINHCPNSISPIFSGCIVGCVLIAGSWVDEDIDLFEPEFTEALEAEIV